jgi:predicted DNA-binding protein with PD1-like motif
MKSKLLHNKAGEKIFVLVFNMGDEVVQTLLDFARKQHIRTARLMAVGGFSEATLGHFDMGTRNFSPIHVREQVEVASLVGSLAVNGENPEQPKLHMHAVVGKPDGTALAGHLLQGTVRPTLEMFVVISPVELDRCNDPATGLALLRV